jgi:hypothetical protein
VKSVEEKVGFTDNGWGTTAFATPCTGGFFLFHRAWRCTMPRLFSASRISGTFHVMDALLLGATA